MVKSTKEKIDSLSPKLKEKINHLIGGIVDIVYNLYSQSIIDPKTNLYNNRFLEEVLIIELENSRRYNLDLSMIILDIDFFKKVNDTYGHIKADQLLIELAKVLEKTIRKSDIAARFGGEEFILVLPNTSLIKAKNFSLRLRNEIKKNKLLKKYNITCSFGVAGLNPKDTIKSFKERADKALYLAKKNGRDRIEIIK